jgi:cation diffusion facilitator CzcD-associated flavoprotein CzcO
MANLLRKLLPARMAYALTRTKNIVLQHQLIAKSRNQPEQVKDYLFRQLEEQLGSDFDRGAFSPPYNPWEQRMCLIPDGDLFRAIKAGKASIVTGQIAIADRTGIALGDGRHIEADIIVTATGLRIATLGKTAVTLDGQPVDFSQTYYYRNCMFSNVPNFAALFGYLNAAWTLRVDSVADWLCRLFYHKDAWGVDVVTPFLAEDHGLTEANPLDYFSSGYLQRARQLIPKSASSAPWRLGMDYPADRRELRDTPIDDGVLRFTQVNVVPANAGTAGG